MTKQIISLSENAAKRIMEIKEMMDLGRERGFWGWPVRPAQHAPQAGPKTCAYAPSPPLF